MKFDLLLSLKCNNTSGKNDTFQNRQGQKLKYADCIICSFVLSIKILIYYNTNGLFTIEYWWAIKE